MKQSEQSSWQSHQDAWITVIYCSVSQSLVRKVQPVQNAAAQLLIGPRRECIISSVLRQLNWLPVLKRTECKLTCMLSLLVFVQPCTSVLGWQYSFGLGRSLTSTPLIHRQITCRSTYIQHIWRQELCCRWVTCVEQSRSLLARRGHFRRFVARACLVLWTLSTFSRIGVQQSAEKLHFCDNL